MKESMRLASRRRVVEVREPRSGAVNDSISDSSPLAIFIFARNAAVPAANSDGLSAEQVGVSPLDATRCGTPRELADEDARATPK